MDALTFPWIESPPAASLCPIIDGLRWARMPLPFALDHVNVWLLDDASGVTAIDTGVNDLQTRRIWSQLVDHHALQIDRLLITHYHPDHIGLAGWLVDQSGAEVFCSEPEWQAATRAINIEDELFTAEQDRWFGLHGLDEQLRARFIRAGNTYRPLVGKLPARSTPVKSGESLTINSDEWDVHTVGGHAIDMVCLHNAESNLLIAADHLLPAISPNVSLNFYHADSNPMASFLAGLDRFKTFDPDVLVLPSHGLPFRGLHQRIVELEQHHQTRFEILLDYCSIPRTACEALQVLFRKSLAVEQLMFAIGESIAHLHYLASTGELQCFDKDGKRYYHRSN